MGLTIGGSGINTSSVFGGIANSNNNMTAGG